MKVTNFADKKLGLEGNDDDIVMGIDKDNHLTLLNSLTHLYSNPVMAALREYCANAADAHRDAGQSKPFEVEFPFSYDHKPNLRIRDYGKGMSREQLTRIYSQYGATTKANNNKQVGGFGLGSKSGLAVSNHLFVNTVSNGVRIEAKVLRNTDNTSVIRILSEKPTTAPSGTEIILPLDGGKLRELMTNAEAELVGYRPEQVTLNGTPLQRSVYNTDLFIPVKLGTNTLAYIARNSMKEQHSYHDSRKTVKTNYAVVMGGVYYPNLPTMGSVHPASTDLFDYLDESFRNSPQVILNVPVGSVDLPPHRDSIIDTEKTWNALLSLLSNVRMGLEASLNSYLNSYHIHDAAKISASMRYLFCPDGTWVHKGKTYDNDLTKVMAQPPFLFSHVSPYYGGGRTQCEGKVSRQDFTALHTRANGNEFNYLNRRKDKVAVIHLRVPSDKYQEINEYYENSRAHYSNRVKMAKPKVHLFITRNLVSVVSDLHNTEQFWVVVTDEKDSALPDNIVSAIDQSMTENEVKAEYRRLNPPKAKTAVTQKHCRVTPKLLEYSLVESSEKIAYIGGKGAYGTEDFMGNPGGPLDEVAAMKKVSNGTNSMSDENSWAWGGLLNILPARVSLVALGDTRSAALFQKAFPESTPFAHTVMDFYENLDEDRKLAVQHAYSIVALWKDRYRQLFALLSGYEVRTQNKSIGLMFSEPELISIGHYLYAFKDSYAAGFPDWKKDFHDSIQDKKLAGYMLLPIQSLMENLHVYTSDNSYYIKQTGAIHSSLKVRGSTDLALDTLVEFIDKLTA